MKDGANPMGKKGARMEYLQHILIKAQSYRLKHGHLIDDMIRYVHFDIFVIHFGLFLANTCVMQRPSMHVLFFLPSVLCTHHDSPWLNRTR